MLKNVLAALALTSFVVVLPGCSSAAAVGETCEIEGAADECVDGAICGKPDDNAAPQCLVVCTSDADCDANRSCNGVSGSSIKACRIKHIK